MASKDGLDLPRFYDAEQRQYSSTQDFSAAEIARRPWKAFWPPRLEKSSNVWRCSEFPEVLSWRFDPNQPFDQPWRDWLRSILMKDEDGSCQRKYSWNGNQAGPNKSELSSTSAMDIDNQITGLPKIQVDSFKYLAPLDIYKTEKPFFSQLPCGTPLARTNLVESNHPVEIHDICGKESLFKLDEAGFQFVQVPTKTSEWTDESVQAEYLPELSAWLKEYFSCEEVFIYNYNLRTNDLKETGKGPWRSPIFRVHCGTFQSYPISNNWPKSLDNTPQSCAKRLEFQFPAKVEAISSGRYRYIDIWRCVAGQDVDSPLALCDYRSIATTDLWNIDIVYPHFCEEGYELTYSSNHRWFYKKGMSKEDAVLFKLGDNLATVAQFAPHAAFIDPSASGNSKRASIEVRAIIIGG